MGPGGPRAGSPLDGFPSVDPGPAPYLPGRAPNPYAVPTREKSPRRTPTLTGQRLLLVTGVALVLIAAIVFLAVSWRQIGVVGQVGVMALLTATAAASSLLTSRRDLRSSAESLAVLASGLLLLDVFAARRLGLAGLDEVSARSYTAVAGLLAGLVLAALHLTDRRVKAFAFLSLTSLSIGVGGLAARVDGAAAFSTVAIGAAVLFGAMAIWLPARSGHLRTAAGGPAGGWLFLATIGAMVSALNPPRGGIADAGEELTCVALLALIAAGGTLVVRRVIVVRRAVQGPLPEGAPTISAQWMAGAVSGRWRALGLVAASSTLAAVAAVVGLGVQLGDVATALLAAILILPVALLCLDDHGLTASRRWALGTTIAAQLCLYPVAVDSRAATGAVVLSLAASVLVIGVARAGSRVVLFPLTVVLAAFGSAVLVEPYGRLPLIVTLSVIATAAVAVAGWRRGQAEEIGLGTVATTLLLICAAIAASTWEGSRDIPLTAGVLALLGALALGYAFLPGRRLVVTLAVTGFIAAVWVVLADRDVRQVEAYSLPLAVMVLAADRWLRRPAAPPWRFVSRAVMIALVPSTFASAFGDGLVRPLVTMGLAVAVFAVAHRLRWGPLAAVAGGAQVVLFAVAVDDQLVLGITALAAVVTVVLLALAQPEQRGLLAPAAVALTSIGVALLVEPAGRTALILTLIVLGILWVAGAAARRGQPEEIGVGAIGLLVLLAAAGVAYADPRSVTLTVVALCVVGALAVGYAGLPARRHLIVLAVLAFTAALRITLVENDISTIEAYSLPLAVMILGAGLWLRGPEAPSWAFAGPAVVVGLVPSALVSLGDDGAIRPLLTIVAGAVVLAVGVTLRWQALVLTGAVVTLLVSVTQVAPYASRLPRWLTLALVGALLLGLGIRYESSRRGARRAVDWVGALE